MADFTARTPVEPIKLGDYLHERANRPASPRPGLLGLARRHWGLVLGVVLALLGSALVVETRVAWDSHRDWVPSATIVGAVFAGLSLGYLTGRGKLGTVVGALCFLSLAIVFMVMNIYRSSLTEGPDRGRDALTILTTICIAISFAWFILTALVIELRSPTRVPPPQT